MTDRVQFREDEEVISYVESMGANPNELARRLFQEEVRRLKAEEKLRRIRAANIKLPRPAAEMIREDRDAR